MYEIETSKLPLRRLATELFLYREFVAAARDAQRLPPKMYRILQRIPRKSDRLAWDALTAEEKREAQLALIEEEGPPE